MTRLVSIQHIQIRWSKYERGPRQGAARKALPRAFAFDPPTQSDEGWLQEIFLGARANYFPVTRWCRLPRRADHKPIVVRRRGDLAEVSLRDFLHKPSRPNLIGLVGRLPFGKRMSLFVNTAWDYRSQRGYDEHAFHIAYAETPGFDLPLHREIDERVLLY